MTNKKKEAIKILKGLLTEIDTIKDVKAGNNWKSKLKDTLKLYVGENSAICQRLDVLYFTRKETKIFKDAIGIYDEYIYDDNKKQDFKNLINNAIDYINSNGVFKNPNKGNFISSFSNTEIIGGVVFALGLSYGVGNFFGKLEVNKETIQLETKIKETERYNEALKLEMRNLQDSITKIQNKKKEISIDQLQKSK